MTGKKLRSETRNAVLMGVIFVVALLLVYLSETSPKTEESGNEVEKPYLFEFNPNQVVQLEITDQNGNTFLHIKKDEERWLALTPHPGELNSDVPMVLLSKVALIRANRVLYGQDENLAAFGLQTPAISFRLLLLDGSRTTLQIGGESPNTVFRYALTEVNNTVYLIPSNTVAIIDSLTKQLFNAIADS